MFRMFSPKPSHLTLEKQIFDLFEKRTIDIKHIRFGYLQNNSIFIEYVTQHTLFRMELSTMIPEKLDQIICFLYKKVLKEYVYIGKFKHMEACIEYITILLEKKGEMTDGMIDILC